MAKRKRITTLPRIAAREPGYEDRREVRTRMVDNPLVPGTVTEASVNIRATAVAWLYSRRMIDAAQKAAADRLERLFRISEVGPVRGLAYGDRVDGGRMGEALTDARITAARELEAALAVVGRNGKILLDQVVCQCRPLGEVARLWPESGGIVKGNGAAGFVAERLREALQDLAEHWGMAAAVGPDRGKIRGTRGRDIAIAGPPREFAVSICGDMVDVARRPLDQPPIAAARKRKRCRRNRSA